MSNSETDTFLYWLVRPLRAVLRCFREREVIDYIDAGYCLDRKD